MFTVFIIVCVVCIIIAIASAKPKDEHPVVDDGVKDAVSQVLDGTWEKEQKKFWNEMLELVLSEHKHERSITFTVVGGYYRSKAAQEEYIYLDKATPISLRREPGNSYDPYAVKVLSDRKHIGYVPKDLSRLVSEVIDQKCVSGCYVVDNDYAYRNEDADGMQVTLWIKDKFENRLDLDGIDPPEEPIKQD